MKIDKREDGHKSSLSLEGQLKAADAIQFKEALFEALQSYENISVNFSKVTGVSVSCMETLLEFQNAVDEKKNATLVLWNLSDLVRKTFASVGFLELFDIRSDSYNSWSEKNIEAQETEAAEDNFCYLMKDTVLLGHYQILQVIGQGGFGITYKAIDLRNGQLAAIKEYYPYGVCSRNVKLSDEVTFLSAKDREGLFVFQREAKLLLECKHIPGIVDVKEYFEENQTAYIVMEYLSGQNLSQCLLDQTFDADTIFSMLRPVFDGLSMLHRLGIVHRDISPDNLLMAEDGKLKLIDFGSAMDFDYEDGKTVTMVLKSGYAPEEQYRSKEEIGPWSDVYALCATIYKCITGITPVNALQRVYCDTLKMPSKLGCNISKHQEDILKRGLCVYYANRPQSIEELLGNHKRKKHLIWGLILGLMAGTLAIASWYMLRPTKTEKLDYKLEIHGEYHNANYVEASAPAPWDEAAQYTVPYLGPFSDFDFTMSAEVMVSEEFFEKDGQRLVINPLLVAIESEETMAGDGFGVGDKRPYLAYENGKVWCGVARADGAEYASGQQYLQMRKEGKYYILSIEDIPMDPDWGLGNLPSKFIGEENAHGYEISIVLVPEYITGEQNIYLDNVVYKHKEEVIWQDTFDADSGFVLMRNNAPNTDYEITVVEELALNNDVE